MELKKFSQEDGKKKPSSRMQRHKDSRTWALKAKEEKTSVLKNQSEHRKKDKKMPKQSKIHL